MITLTEKAVDKVKELLVKESKEGYGLRVAVRGGGCSGFNYTLDLTDQKAEEDEVFVNHGIEVLCDPKSYLYLNGVTIDFRDEVMGRGFVFNNPNATSSCGCGSSFSP